MTTPTGSEMGGWLDRGPAQTLLLKMTPHPSPAMGGKAAMSRQPSTQQKKESPTDNNRPTVRCQSCGLNQFENQQERCCRCKNLFTTSSVFVAALSHGLIAVVLAERKKDADALRARARRLATIGGALAALVRVFRDAEDMTQEEYGLRQRVGRKWVARAEANGVRWDHMHVSRAAAVTGIPGWVLVDMASLAVGDKSVLGGD